jgi:CheY-like chemotaxis protein
VNYSQPATLNQPIKILLVDDDEGDVLLTRKTIQKEQLNISLDVVFDGVEAMEYLRQEDRFSNADRPDLILLDLNMPRKDGKTTLAEIKSDVSLHSIPVVVLTTSDADQDVIKTFGLQTEHYVTKPVCRQQFAEIVQTIS